MCRGCPGDVAWSGVMGVLFLAAYSQQAGLFCFGWRERELGKRESIHHDDMFLVGSMKEGVYGRSTGLPTMWGDEVW